MHEPSSAAGKQYIPGKGGGAVAQQMPIRANAPTIILPPQKVPRTFAGSGGKVRTGVAIPANHALWVVSNGALTLTLVNDGEDDIVLPLPAVAPLRIIPIKEIGFVDAAAAQGVSFTLWIEDLRAMEPWICEGEFRP